MYAESGAHRYDTKSHYENPDDSNLTLCGTRIPEICDGWDNDLCRRCERIDEKERTCNGET
jgi:hypothetical protein